MAYQIDLSGRVALVTGASRGIGRAIALALGQSGAAVAVNFRARQSEADEVVAQIRALGARAVALQADVSVSAEAASLAERAAQQLGAIDILVNNAGIALPDSGEESFDRTLAANLKSAYLMTEAVLPGMRTRGFGRIVNLSSIAARGAGAIGVAYNASKAGLEGLTRGYAGRVAKDGVTVNAVAPGPTDTEMAAPLKAAGVAARVPLGRMGTAEEVAEATLLLIANPFITGQTIAVNGGLAFV